MMTARAAEGGAGRPLTTLRSVWFIALFDGLSFPAARCRRSLGGDAEHHASNMHTRHTVLRIEEDERVILQEWGVEPNGLWSSLVYET